MKTLLTLLAVCGLLACAAPEECDYAECMSPDDHSADYLCPAEDCPPCAPNEVCGVW